jgi:hypothetical protein
MIARVLGLAMRIQFCGGAVKALPERYWLNQWV